MLPGFMAQTDEIVEMARVAARRGGLYVSHIRDESGRVSEDQDWGVLKALKEAIEIGRRAELADPYLAFENKRPFRRDKGPTGS